jgi:tetratricopeptide (TPR) repeat protein
MGEMVVEQQASPLQRADFALQQGAPGLAIQELEEALQINVNPAAVKPQLIDLYCDTGQPEKALDLLNNSTSIEDPALGAEPGVAALRQGRVYLLLGNYEYASTLLEKHAIPPIRLERSFKTLGAAQVLLHGELKAATSTFLSVPGKLSTQAMWENELGLCRLEAGQPTLAVKDLEHSLTLVPGLPNRAVTAYYLEKLGGKVAPLPEPAEGAADAPKDAPDAKPEASKEKDARPEKATETPKEEG